MGDNTSTDVPTVVTLGAGRTAKSVSASTYHTCAVLDDDTVKCWASNGGGQLGMGDFIARYTPVAVDFTSSSSSSATAGADRAPGPGGPPGPDAPPATTLVVVSAAPRLGVFATLVGVAAIICVF